MFGKKIKDPVQGYAHVLGVAMPVESQGAIMRVKLHLLIEAEGIEPRQVEESKMLKRKKIPQAGMVLPVTVDRKDPSKWEIDWDTAPTRQDMMNAQAQAIIDAGGIGAANTIDQSAPAAPAGGDDRVERLATLASLHQAGALTDEEFAAEKARLLSG